MIATAMGTVFLERLRFYQEIAEKASMEATLRQIKTGLQIRLAELIIAKGPGPGSGRHDRKRDRVTLAPIHRYRWS
jgi:hypothetical protein